MWSYWLKCLTKEPVIPVFCEMRSGWCSLQAAVTQVRRAINSFTVLPKLHQIVLVDIVESGPDGKRMSVYLDNQMIVDQVV